MKQLTFLLLMAALLAACNKADDEEPDNGSLTASFTIANPGPVTAGCTEVLFTNTSQNADSYAWDFGDGNTSDLENPTHVYANAGTYNVLLIAKRGSEVKESTLMITVSAFSKFSHLKNQTRGKPATVQTSDGGFVTAGVDCSVNGTRQARVYKIDANGVLQWEQILGGETTYTTDVALAPDGSLLICGYSTLNASVGTFDGYVWKLNPSGNVIWERRVDEQFDQFLESIITFSDGSCWAVGYNILLNTVGVGFIVGFDANGNQLFAKNTGGAGSFNYAMDLVETADGQVLICGYGNSDLNSNGSNAYDIWVRKISRNDRSSIWLKSFGSIGQSDIPNAVIRTRDNGFALVGGSNYYVGGISNSYPLFLKIDGNGNQINLLNSLSGIPGGWSALAELPDGSLTITGITDVNLLLINMNASGNTINWFKTINSPGAYSTEGWNVLALSAGGYVISGITTDPTLTFEGTKSWLFKTDCSGN